MPSCGSWKLATVEPPGDAIDTDPDTVTGYIDGVGAEDGDSRGDTADDGGCECDCGECDDACACCGCSYGFEMCAIECREGGVGAGVDAEARGGDRCSIWCCEPIVWA